MLAPVFATGPSAGPRFKPRSTSPFFEDWGFPPFQKEQVEEGSSLPRQSMVWNIYLQPQVNHPLPDRQIFQSRGVSGFYFPAKWLWSQIGSCRVSLATLRPATAMTKHQRRRGGGGREVLPA